MVKITYKEKEYVVKDSWLDVKIGTMQNIIQLYEQIHNEFDLTVAIVAELTGISIDDLLDIPYTELMKLKDLTSYINGEIPDKLFNSFTHDGVEYIFTCNIDSLSTGEYIDLNKLTESSDAKHLHTVMGIVYREKDTDYDTASVLKRAEIFKEHMPFSYAIAAQVFMEVLGQISNEHISTCSSKQK